MSNGKTGKGRCTVCGCLHALRLNGLIVNHQRTGNGYFYYCTGGGLLPQDPARTPTWEARALAAEQRVEQAEQWAARADAELAEAKAIIQRIENLPTAGGTIKASDLARAMGAGRHGELQ